MRAWHKHGRGGEYHLSRRVAGGSLMVAEVYAGTQPGRWFWYTTESGTLRPGAPDSGVERTLRAARAAVLAALSDEED